VQEHNKPSRQWMGKIETASHPRALANTAKHCTFTRCGELNGAQIALLETELLRE